MEAKRSIAFQECGRVQVVIASESEVKCVGRQLILPPPLHEVVLAYPLTDEQQREAWEALMAVPDSLLRPAMDLVGEGFALRVGFAQGAR